jgi:hypothetical protein
MTRLARRPAHNFGLANPPSCPPEDVCQHARLPAREREKAIAAVGEALPLIPRPAEWSREDPDLDGLRDLSAFQALYTR